MSSPVEPSEVRSLLGCLGFALLLLFFVWIMRATGLAWW